MIARIENNTHRNGGIGKKSVGLVSSVRFSRISRSPLICLTGVTKRTLRPCCSHHTYNVVLVTKYETSVFGTRRGDKKKKKMFSESVQLIFTGSKRVFLVAKGSCSYV